MANSFSREKLRHAPQKKVDEKSCVTPAGTSNEFDVQNEWEENTHNTHAADMKRKTRYIFSRLTLVVLSIFKRPAFEILSP